MQCKSGQLCTVIEEPKQAAIFDFDGILYNPENTWRVTTPLLGRPGSLARMDDAMKFIRRHMGSDVRILDYYALDAHEYQVAHKDEVLNLLTPDLLRPTARGHQIRGRQLYILTLTDLLGIRDIIMRMIPKEEGPFENKNPFDNAKNLLLRDTELIDIKRARELPLARMRRILSLLRHTDNRNTAQPGPFSRIFLYTTDRILAELITDQMAKIHQDLVDGRNSVIVHYVAKEKA